jgi:hypothetical protein
MAVEYPDVMNDALDARQRYESGAVQYLAELPTQPTPAGQVVRVAAVLQSVMDVPVKVALHVALPELNRKLRRLDQPLFQIFQPDITLTLSNGEVAELIIPIHIQPHVPADTYQFAIHVRAQAVQEGMRIRSSSGENRVGDLLIRRPQGLRIAQLASWGFEARQSPSQPLPIAVAEAGELPEEIDLKPQFNTLWTPADWEIFPRARQEANDRRIYAVPELTVENLYLPFIQESQVFFGDAGVQLHVGEAIFLSKLLTYTVTYLMSNAEWQEILLVPIYAAAQLAEQPSDDVIWLVTEFGYTHVIELAAAISFTLVGDTIGREIWSPTEQRLLREFIVSCLEEGNSLPPEFLYLPLLLGGIAVAREITFEEEDITESMRLLSKAKAERGELFEAEDLSSLNDAFDRLMAKQSRGRGR